MDEDKLMRLFSRLLDFLPDAGTLNQRQVWRFEEGGVTVSTARVSDGDLPFETSVAHPQYNDGKWMVLEAYRTRDEARVGHHKWVATMTGPQLPERLEDCCNAPAAKLLKELGEKLEYPRKDRL